MYKFSSLRFWLTKRRLRIVNYLILSAATAAVIAAASAVIVAASAAEHEDDDKKDYAPAAVSAKAWITHKISPFRTLCPWCIWSGLSALHST